MKDLLKLAKLQIGITVIFFFFKSIRPTILKTNSYEWIKITLLSLPNFFEAIIGILTLTGIGIYSNAHFISETKQIKRHIIYALASIIGGIYVITQEFKIHNLGGENVFDWNDVIFSIIGLFVGYITVLRIQPKITL